jgi:hypothetical protein
MKLGAEASKTIDLTRLARGCVIELGSEFR